MKVKVTIEKNTPAAREFETYVEAKKAFRKAAEEGKLQEYVETMQEKFAAPSQALVPQH